jgi:hypothetical protein
MATHDEKRTVLVRELLAYFDAQGFEIVGARDVEGHPRPPAIRNSGFGDQEDKRPDILAHDTVKEQFVVGLARSGDGDFESESSLTEYNVFLDQCDAVYGQPYRLYLIAPSSRIQELQSLITHYIHREYWYKVTFVSSYELES